MISCFVLSVRALIYQVEREREKYGVEAVEQRKLYEAAVGANTPTMMMNDDGW